MSMEAHTYGLIGPSEGCVCCKEQGQNRSAHSQTPATTLMLLSLYFYHVNYHHSKSERWIDSVKNI